MSTFDIREIAKTCLANSERWFPWNHTTHERAVTHCTLGLAGEAGEVANKIKKHYGYRATRQPAHNPEIVKFIEDCDEAVRHNIIEELVDTLIYDLVLLQLFEADIPQAIADKIAVCEARWGGAS